MEEASSSVENYSSKLDEAKQAMTELFSQQNGSTAGVETYFKNTLDLVTNLKEQQKRLLKPITSKLKRQKENQKQRSKRFLPMLQASI